MAISPVVHRAALSDLRRGTRLLLLLADGRRLRLL